MTETEREAFLADLHVAVLSVERPEGPPLAGPVWYRYAPGGAVEFQCDASSVKARLVKAAGRVTMCVQQEQAPYKYVTVSGPAEIVDTSFDDSVELAVRYLGETEGRAYAEGIKGDEVVMVRVTPERWLSVDYGKLG